MSNPTNNITFSLDEEINIDVEESDSNFDMNSFLNEMEKDEFQQDLMVPNIIHYHENFTIKELLVICEYYGIAKELKSNKCNKDTIVQILTNFEINSKNYEIVSKRKNLWFYMNELKNDKFMKKFLLW
jgi:hypothetical protein